MNKVTVNALGTGKRMEQRPIIRGKNNKITLKSFLNTLEIKDTEVLQFLHNLILKMNIFQKSINLNLRETRTSQAKIKRLNSLS